MRAIITELDVIDENGEAVAIVRFNRERGSASAVASTSITNDVIDGIDEMLEKFKISNLGLVFGNEWPQYICEVDHV